MTLAHAGASRWSGIGVTVALHVLLALGFLLQRTDSGPEPQPRWMQVFQVPPVSERGMIPPPDEPRRTERRRTATRVGATPAPVVPPDSQAPSAVADSLFPSAEPPAAASVFERARAEAGNVARALGKEFPEHPNRLRARPRTAQQKLASGIENAQAPPKLYEAPRIIAIQDQGTGWGRRIDKVVTGNGTYCITYESNHGGDGRDVFKDALEPKIRTCPREE